jgi:hypothetical protein
VTPVLTFNEARHEYHLDGRLVPSVTQVLRGAGLISLVDFADQERKLMVEMGYSTASLVPSEILQHALARGTRVHKACHYLSEGLLDWDTVDEKDRPYVDAAAQFLADTRFELLLDQHGRPVGRELRLYSTRYVYAGTSDLVGRWNGQLAIVDWKTGNPEDVCADLQLAAYENALREMPELAELLRLKPGDTILRCSVRLRKDGEYAPTPYNKPKHARDFSYFQAALTLEHYKTNKAA